MDETKRLIITTQSDFDQNKNTMQNTNSERFTSIKKHLGPSNLKINRFSSSGIGNFQMSHGGNKNKDNNMLPPFSPTPTTDQMVGPRINHVTRKVVPNTTSPNLMIAPSEIDAPTEMIE